jgi:hypothetical protein
LTLRSRGQRASDGNTAIAESGVNKVGLVVVER